MANVGMLSTAFAVLALAACAVLAWLAYKFCDRAEEAAAELRASVGKVKSHELALDAHHQSIARINGKIGRLVRDGVIPPASRFAGEPPDLAATEAALSALDPEFAAELDLQRAPAASPGNRKG